MCWQTLRLLLGLCLFALNSVASAAEPAKKWNVLLLMADDWRPELACYGVRGMVTPNVDKLAAAGVRFDRAYCQFPVCNPSRASMLTGRYPNQTRVVFNGTHLRDQHPDWITLPQYFKNQGYVTAVAGKIFHGKIPDPQSWSDAIEENVPREFRKAKSAVPDADGDGGAGPAGVKFVVLDGDGESDKDYHIAADGIRLLEKYCDQPFFIGIGFHRPHAIPTAPKKFYDLYNEADMPLPADFATQPGVPPGTPAIALKEDNDPYMAGETTPEVARRVIRAYRASASWTDWNLGRVLDALDRLQLADKTIVVFVSDHGYHNGEKGRWGKTTVYEIAQRVPLVIRVPGCAGNGQACSRTVQLIDLYPTLAELCSLPTPPDVQGHSLTPLLHDPAAAWDHPAFSMAKTGGSPIGYGVRTGRWRYAEWKQGSLGAVLFDETNDPHEVNNLADRAEYAEVVKQMKALLQGAFDSMPERIDAVRR